MNEKVRHTPEQPRQSYQLESTGALAETLGEKGLNPIFKPGITFFTDHYFHPDTPEIRQVMHNDWRSYAATMGYQTIHREPIVLPIEPESLKIVGVEHFSSGVNKVTGQIGTHSTTAFIYPSGSYPIAYYPWDLPNNHKGIRVGASLQEAADFMNDDKYLGVSASGLTSFFLYADAIYLHSSQSSKEVDNVISFIRNTQVSIDTRSDNPYFSPNDFFDQLEKDPKDKEAWKGRIRRDNGQKPYWIVTQENGRYEAIDVDTLLQKKENPAYRNTIISCVPILAYANKDILEANPLLFSLKKRQLINIVLLFETNGEQRIGTMHGYMETDFRSMFELAKKMVEGQEANVTKLAIGILDGGGCVGATVRKEANWNPSTTDTSATATRPIRHTMQSFLGIALS